MLCRQERLERNVLVISGYRLWMARTLSLRRTRAAQALGGRLEALGMSGLGS